MCQSRNRAGLVLAFVAFAVLTVNAADAPTPAPEITSIWEGPLKVGPIELRLAFTISKTKDGKLEGKFESIDQGAKDIPCGDVTFAERKLTIPVPVIKGTFVGTLAADGQTVDGEWEQAGQKFPLHLKRVEKASTLNRPQVPKPPFPYKSEEVTFENPDAKIKLAGTLTLPKGEGPFPVAVMVSGSGPQDRDETLFGHKPFLVLADHLSRNGIAVLRYDDRGVGKSTGTQVDATSADLMTDARSAVNFLKKRKDIDPKRIGIIGHSEGGVIGPMLAADRPADVGFLVLLSGPGVPGHQVLLGQSEALLKAMKVSDEKIALQMKIVTKLAEIARSPGSADEKKTACAEAVKKMLTDLTDDEKKVHFPKGNVEAEIEKAAKNAAAKIAEPWQLYFINFDPASVLSKVKCPVLALNGSLDLQVLPKENLAGIEKALKSAGNERITLKELPGLNHLFQKAKTGLPNEYGQIEETIAPEVLSTITEWIQGIK